MSYFFNRNQTGFCQTNEVISKISNLTASYTAGNGGGQEQMTMVSGPIIMFILIALFLRGTFDARAVLGPNFRLLLSSALALFLPVMSYLFSEAKDAAGGGGQRSTASGDDLSVRARVILTWMLLVELLRKKVDEIRVQGSYSGTIQRAGRVVWLGSLVYFNIISPGRKAVFSVLWVLCATKLLQRIIFTEVEKRAYPDKSWLISSYMAEVERANVLDGDNEDLKGCNYIVMGEEKLAGEVTADGYKLNTISAAAHGHHGGDCDSGIITVGKLWQLAETDKIFNQFDRNASIRRVCLSFALFKLLRRRFEHLPPMTPEEAHNCRKIMLSRVLHPRGDDDADEVVGTLFSMMADEVKFLSEYYHSVVPVILASPLFLLVNYFLVPVAVLVLCLIAIAVCGRGDVSHALSSMSADNYALQPGFAKLAICALVRAGHSRPALLFTLDLLITLLLLIIFFAEEIWEFVTVLISNWFIISMVCSYVTKTHWRENVFISSVFRWILWLQRKMSKYASKFINIRLKQFSLLSSHSGPRLIAALVPGTLYLNVKSVPMTTYLKLSIGNCLAKHIKGDDLNHVMPVPVIPHRFMCINFSREYGSDSDGSDFWMAYGSESATEMILTWHIATCVLEVEDNSAVPVRIKDDAAAAVSLSRYCAYLVVFHPELLPDRRAKAERVLKNAKEELRNLLGFWGYYLSSPRARARDLFYYSLLPVDTEHDGVVHRGIRLASQMRDLGLVPSWEVLADVWTELLVHAAPVAASDEEHVRKAHADILVEGVELITVLWAFAMHTGMERMPPRREMLATASSDEWKDAPVDIPETEGELGG